MPIATPEVYGEMIDRAKSGSFAYPAINITSSQTLIAAMRGFAEAESDGIIQVSVGGAEYASGSTAKDRVAGSLALAAYAREVAKNYPVTFALHTDHCAEQNLDSWVRPLLQIEADEVKAGRLPLFQSHMWDGSTVDLETNLGEIQEAVGKEVGKERPFDLVFHGGSGSTEDEVRTAVKNGVIKMNIDTDTQYAFTRPVVDHIMSNYDGVLKVDGEVGNKKAYDPRAWGKLAEAGMAARIVEAAQQLRSAGQRLR
jgi:fructose/tagatose bisphosphate aldolase